MLIFFCPEPYIVCWKGKGKQNTVIMFSLLFLPYIPETPYIPCLQSHCITFSPSEDCVLYTMYVLYSMFLCMFLSVASWMICHLLLLICNYFLTQGEGSISGDCKHRFQIPPALVWIMAVQLSNHVSWTSYLTSPCLRFLSVK